MQSAVTCGTPVADAESSKVVYPRELWHNQTRADIKGNPKKKAASLGLEPRQRDPESLVLPLHHEATARGTRPKAEFPRCASGSRPDAFAISRGSSPHLRARLRPRDSFRFSRLTSARSRPSCRSFRHRASGRGGKESAFAPRHRSRARWRY